MSEQEKKLDGPDFARGVSLGDLTEGSMISGQVGGEAVVLARTGGALFAIGAECTHYHGPLAEGMLVADTVRCPWHHACFSLRTGEALRAPALNPVSCWRVEQQDGKIYVREKLEPAERRARTAAGAVPESIVILGGGAAGNAAAEMLRREGYSGPVTMLSADDAGPYDRPNLSKDYLAGNAPEEWIPLRSPDFYREHGIELKLGVRAVAIDPKGREVRRAMALSLDRKAFIDIISEGHGDIGGVMQPLPEGVWGMPEEFLRTLPGYDPDAQKSRAEAREIMHKLGYGPDNRLALKVSTRNIPPFRDPAVILIDQLKEVFIDGELEIVETALWYPKMYRKDYKIGLNLTGGGVDDPDQQFYENYGCGSPRNYTGYCNPELESLFEQQSMEADEGKRKKLVWEIERRLAEDGARPIIFYNRFAYCWHPRVKGWTMMVNSITNNWRMEDVWLDK